MDLSKILSDQAEWTWGIMAASSQLGEMIREDAITSVNLATINAKVQENNIPLSITSLQGAKLEKEFGGDWLWGKGQSVYLVQAKRLDVVKKDTLLSYSIDLSQLNLLLSTARILSTDQGIDAIPAYVFYNSLIQGPKPSLYGCTWGNAFVLGNYFYGTLKLSTAQQTASITPKVLQSINQWNPWVSMFG